MPDFDGGNDLEFIKECFRKNGGAPTKKTLVQNVTNYQTWKTAGTIEPSPKMVCAFYKEDGTMYILPNLMFQNIEDYDFTKNKMVEYEEYINEDDLPSISIYYGYAEKGNNYLTHANLVARGPKEIPSEVIVNLHLEKMTEERINLIKGNLEELGCLMESAYGFIPEEELLKEYLLDMPGSAK